MSVSWNPEETPAQRRAQQSQSAENAAEGFGIRGQGNPASAEPIQCKSVAINLAAGQRNGSGSRTSKDSASRSSQEGGMSRRVRRRQTSLTYLPMASEAVREDELLARLWGCQPASAHTRKQRLPEHLRDVIAVRRTLGKTESLATYLLPVEDALAHPMRPCDNAEKCADVTDAVEDLVQAEYRANPCEATARDLLRKRAADRMAALDHDREIAARWGIVL